MNSEYVKRSLVIKKLFDLIISRESCAVIGSSSMGKSRLIRSLLSTEVRGLYLASNVETTLLVLCDAHRIAEISEFGIWELLLTSLTEASANHPIAKSLFYELNVLRREVIIEKNGLFARRQTELAMRRLCQDINLTVCVLWDEFDKLYEVLPTPVINTLRALRDDNKAWLSYVLFMRDIPEHLRPPSDCEGFYELFSRSIIGLTPYHIDDIRSMVDDIAKRRKLVLTDSQYSLIAEYSGGHPGSIVAIIDILFNSDTPKINVNDEILLTHPKISEECRKLWDGLHSDEKSVLSQIVKNQRYSEDTACRSLQIKGILTEKNKSKVVFSPIFKYYIQKNGKSVNKKLWIDTKNRELWIGDQCFNNLTALEFELLNYLNQSPGKLYTKEDILQRLYPTDCLIENDNRLEALMGRLREKIEPVKRRPQYLITVKNQGYRLNVT